jgi:hypothetical protein
MGHYPFTPFNCITAFVLALTVLLARWRFRGPALTANWPLVYWAIVPVYMIGLPGGLNPYWVGAGVVCAVAIRFGFYARQVRWVELVVLGYVAWRSVGLIMMW